MKFDSLECSLLVDDWESVAAEMRNIVENISLECFEQMLREGGVSRSKWVVMFLNTNLHKECEKYDMMLKIILRYTWRDLSDGMRWSLISAILSINDFRFSINGEEYDCIYRAADLVSEYIGVPKEEVVRVINSPDRLSVDLVIASCSNPQ